MQPTRGTSLYIKPYVRGAFFRGPDIARCLGTVQERSFLANTWALSADPDRSCERQEITRPSARPSQAGRPRYARRRSFSSAWRTVAGRAFWHPWPPMYVPFCRIAQTLASDWPIETEPRSNLASSCQKVPFQRIVANGCFHGRPPALRGHSCSAIARPRSGR